jgi:hypothetical protein
MQLEIKIIAPIARQHVQTNSKFLITASASSVDMFLPVSVSIASSVMKNAADSAFVNALNADKSVEEAVNPQVPNKTRTND